MMSRSAALVRVAATAVLCLSTPFAVSQEDCSRPYGETIPSGARRISVTYEDGNPGWWWEIYNWVDGNNDDRIDPGDYFNFRDVQTGTFECPGPSVMKLVHDQPWHETYGTSGETWYYITGTSPGSEPNFYIYRTKDFASFELHMPAFAVSRIVDSQSGDYQEIVDEKLFVNGRWFSHLMKPQLYFDPTHSRNPSKGRRIYISFTACQESTNDYQDASVFLVQMDEVDFVRWHTISDPLNPPSGTDWRFADPRRYLDFVQWYFYRQGNASVGTVYHDGGWAAGHLVPSSGKQHPQDLGASPPEPSQGLQGASDGQLEQRLKGWAFVGPGMSATFDWVMPETFMERDSYVYFDPQRSSNDPWKRVMFYTWSDRNSTNWADRWRWGNRIAAHPMLANNIQFNANYSTIPMAYGINNCNRVKIDGNGDWWNGNFDAANYMRADGGIAEAPAVLYIPEVDRYYMFYCRNAWNSTTYQIVYRKTEPGQPLSSLQIGWTQSTLPEEVLVRNVASDANRKPIRNAADDGWEQYDHDRGHADFTTSFGTPSAFTITSGSGAEYPYIAFAVRMDYHCDELGNPKKSGKRTVFFKELTIEDVGTGKLKELVLQPIQPGSPSATEIDRQANMAVFRIPYCRQQGL